MSEQQARDELARIPNSEPVMKNNRYQGQRLFHNMKTTGFIGISYKNRKPVVAVFSTPPLSIRHATRQYKKYRNALSEAYHETSHNQFELDTQITARLNKEARKLTIDVSRK